MRLVITSVYHALPLINLDKLGLDFTTPASTQCRIRPSPQCLPRLPVYRCRPLMIGVFSGADKMLLFLRLAAGFVSLEKDFVQYNSAGERERERGAETEKIGGLLSSLLSLSGTAHSYRFKFHRFIGDRERCLPVFHFASLFKSKRSANLHELHRGLLSFFPGFSFSILHISATLTSSSDKLCLDLLRSVFHWGHRCVVAAAPWPRPWIVISFLSVVSI